MSEEGKILSMIFSRYDLIAQGSTVARDLLFDHVDYTRFDDWEPLTIQGPEYLQKESDVAKLITGFTFEIFNPRIRLKGNLALAVFYIHYSGQVRTRPFDIWARTTAVMIRDKAWKIWHEHMSRFPGKPPGKLEVVQRTALHEPAVEAPKPTLDSLSEAILEVLKDAKERDAVDLSIVLPEKLGRYVDSSEIRKRCEELEKLGLVERVGPSGLLARYKLMPKDRTQP